MIEINKELHNLPGHIEPLNYDPGKIRAGIAHIGVGNFHRAHQAYYTHKLFNLTTENPEWGIVGIGITASGTKMSEKFEQQDNLYTLTEFEPTGEVQTSVIGSIIEYIPAKENPQLAIKRLADPDIKIVSLTITEGGYKIDQQGEFILDDPDILHDLAHPDNPVTAFGYIIQALDIRRLSGAGPFTILSCDNLQHNGDVAKHAFLSFAKLRSSSLADWIATCISFPNSMVDRITPAVDEDDVARLNKESGIQDAIPVYAEGFTQWVIEDDFCAGRPEWERAGVKFVSDVSPYETLKLRFLNASHSMLAYPAFLAGYRNVDEAIADPQLNKFIRDFMDKDVSPLIHVPEDVKLQEYKDELMQRFENAAVSDQLSRLCYHGGAKIPVFILPTLTELIKKDADTSRLAFLFAAYGHYLKIKTDDKGEGFEVDAPKLTANDWMLVHDTDLSAFLGISPLAAAGLSSFPLFKNTYLKFRREISAKGILHTLSEIY